jgi:hydrogenase maturation protease
VIEAAVVIIGYGNILRRDDGVGWATARRLEDQLPAEQARVITTQQLLPELAEALSRCELAIFIDADALLAGGRVSKREVHAAAGSRPLGHHETPEALLEMARRLYGHSPEALLYSIGGRDFGFGCTLSPAVQLASRKVVREVVDIVLHRRPLAAGLSGN